jgi:nitrogen-specific signal transduction histidine kinase
VAGSREPVLIADNDGHLLFANLACATLRGEAPTAGQSVDELFVQSALVRQAIEQLRASPQSWRRDIELLVPGGRAPLPVAARAEIVHGRDHHALGLIFTLVDLREMRRADEARVHLESSLQQAAHRNTREVDAVLSAIMTNASLAAMDIADARGGPPVAPLLHALETSTRRAAALYEQIRAFNG